MGGFANPIVGGGGALVYPSIHSPNFVLSPLRGWSIQKNGNAYFASLTIGGSVVAVLIYSGVPAAGNLIASITPAAGTDGFGNAEEGGVTSYQPGVSFTQLFDGSLFIGSLNASSQIIASAQANLLDTTLASAQPGLALRSPSTAGVGVALLTLFGESADSTAPAQAVLTSTPGGPITSAFLEVHGSTAIGPAAGSILEFLAATGVAATDTAALAAILSAGNTPVLLPGTFALNCGNATLTSLGPAQYIVGCGDKNTIINAHGSGDLFYWSAASPNSDGNTTGGGFIGGATIDMSACSGAATGIHAGDINALRFDCRVQHSTKTGGSWGFLFDNANTFTERMHINARVKDCGFAGGDGGMVGFQVSGATTSTASFSRLKGRIELTQGSNQQDGVVVQAGAHLYDYDLEIIGNFQAGASATTAAALRITGTVPALHPGAGTHSAMSNGRLNIGLECSSGTHAPTTFIQASTSNSITDTYGNINWNTNFTTSGITGAGFKFFGPVQGDTAMGTRLYYGTAPTQTITANGQTISSTVPSAKIPISAGAPGFTGIILSPGDVDGQLIYLIGTGADPITFAAAGTSNVALGTSAQLAAGAMMALIWDAGSALWYPAT